ncbi:MAG TPA: O-antigen ligase family protein [Edaphobacter sp.]|nr:O-antigen ligase family protein [Edaphobacter sp.]
MIARRLLRQAVTPSYLVLCIVLGGSGQAIWGTLILQLLALTLIAWAVVNPSNRRDGEDFRQLSLIGIAVMSLIGLQLLPLPPELWTRLPGRDVVAAGYGALGEQLPWLPLSLAPGETLSSALFLLPPIAIIVTVMRLDARRVSWASDAIVAATILSVILGYLQVSTRSAGWYLYAITNIGSAVGFFANRDHMGTLLVIAIPFIAIFLADGFGRERRQSLAILSAGFSAGLAVLAGIAMNGSLAAVILAFPVIAGSTLLFGRTSKRIRSIVLIAASCAFIVGLALIADSPVQGKLLGTETASMEGRQEIWATSLQAGAAAFPAGTGFGSFEEVYHLYEDPGDVIAAYVNHAHNDYLELFVEGGLPALLLIAIFLVWWGARVRDAWREGGGRVARAATIASAAILGHSLVDFPLRTSAIAGVFAFCIAILASQRGPKLAQGSILEERRPRHVVIS